MRPYSMDRSVGRSPCASGDPTEARNDILGCFGRSDRSEFGRSHRRALTGRPWDHDRNPAVWTAEMSTAIGHADPDRHGDGSAG
jgi:hypothetical protein